MFIRRFVRIVIAHNPQRIMSTDDAAYPNGEELVGMIRLTDHMPATKRMRHRNHLSCE